MRWAKSISDEFAVGHISYSDGCLYAQSSDRELYAISLRKKSVLWKFEHPEAYKTLLNWYDLCPLISGDTVFVYGSLKNVYAIDKRTGKELWNYGVTGQLLCGRNFVSTDKTLIGVMRDSALHAIDISTGKRVWTKNIGNPIAAQSSPVVIGDAIFLSVGGYLQKISVETGERLFRWEIPS